MRYNSSRILSFGLALLLFGTIVSQSANADLVAHYKLDDGLLDSTTTTAIDSVSPVSNGTLENFPAPPTPKWVTGFTGGALEFGANGNGQGADGDDVVTVPNPSSGKFDINGELSIAAWVLLDTDGGRSSTRHIAGVDRAGGPVGDAYSLKHNGGSTDNDKLAFLIAQGGDTNLVSSDTLTNYRADSVSAGNGGWVHVTGVYVPGTSMSLYINGELDSQLLAGVPSAIDSVTTPFNIGRLDNSSNHSFHGAIDDVQLFNSALTSDEVAGLNASDFKIVIHPASGEVFIQNDTTSPLAIDYYQIESDTAALKPVTGWNSLADQGIDPVNGGDDPGEIWTEGGNSSASLLTELFLQGSTELATSESISLGNAYDTTLGGTPVFEFQTAGTETVRRGKVEYLLLGDMDGNGQLQEADINPFVEALTNRSSYETNNPGVDADLIGDFNGNGQLDLGDIADFKSAIAALATGAANANAVPEPSCIFMLLAAMLGCVACPNRRRVH